MARHPKARIEVVAVAGSFATKKDVGEQTPPGNARAARASQWPLKTTPCVEEFSPRGGLVRVMVHADRAAFLAAVEQYPKSRIRLRNRALVTQEHKPK
jgi:hypothetical protein